MEITKSEYEFLLAYATHAMEEHVRKVDLLPAVHPSKVYVHEEAERLAAIERRYSE